MYAITEHRLGDIVDLWGEVVIRFVLLLGVTFVSFDGSSKANGAFNHKSISRLFGVLDSNAWANSE